MNDTFSFKNNEFLRETYLRRKWIASLIVTRVAMIH